MAALGLSRGEYVGGRLLLVMWVFVVIVSLGIKLLLILNFEDTAVIWPVGR